MKSFDDLWLELSGKAAERPAGSSTVEALDAGIHAMGKKIIEEAGRCGWQRSTKAMKR